MDTGHYAGQTAALATRHHKERVIAPAFHDALGLHVSVIDIDTDSFGTFAGDIPRIDTPFNTAIAKARAGMAKSGTSLGIASEGTIGPDPVLPFVTSDIETIVFIDDDREIVISETTRSTDIVTIREEVTPNSELAGLHTRADFPRHGLIVRPSGVLDGPIIKGITDATALVAAILQCSAVNGTAVVESDLRAGFSPTRMRNISACAELLAQRIATPCPECAGPGWGPIEPVRGLPCSACGANVETAIRADVLGCPACSAVLQVARPIQTVEPRWCPYCNP